MSFNKICVGLAGFILVASIQGCGESDDSKVASSESGAPVSAPAPVEKQIEFTNEIHAQDLIGSWVAGAGRATIEELADGTFQMTNEIKMVANGSIANGILDCKDWNVTGRLSLDKKSLVWSNGAIWQK